MVRPLMHATAFPVISVKNLNRLPLPSCVGFRMMELGMKYKAFGDGISLHLFLAYSEPA